MSVVKKCFKLLKLRQHFDNVPEREVVAYLRNWNMKLKSDNYWNLYLINPWTPLICAHMDTVQKQVDVDRLWTLRLNHWFIKADKAIIWGDDKCWIAIAMELYEQLGDRISLLFTRQEETGCNWARDFCTNHKDLVEQCNYCLVLDRRGSWDIIWYENAYCSKEFEDEIARLTKDFWYKPTRWFCSDTGCIAKIINWVNLSVGYYNPHTENEYINCNELENAYLAALYIVEHLEWEYPLYEYKYTYTQHKDYYWGYSRSLWLFWYQVDENDDDLSENGSDSWKTVKLDKKEKKEKKNDKGNPLFKHIKFTKEWTVIVSDEIYLAPTENDYDDWIILYPGEYDVIESLEE